MRGTRRGGEHGVAFGLLATVNGLGDFASSLIVGLLWTAAGTAIAFAYSGVLFLGGALLVLRSAQATHNPKKGIARNVSGLRRALTKGRQCWNAASETPAAATRTVALSEMKNGPDRVSGQGNFPSL